MKVKFYRPVLYYLLVAVRALFSLFPYRVGYSFGGTMGRLTFRLLPKEKEKTLSHLRLAFGGEKSEKELLATGQAVFENYGKTIAELCMIDKIIPRFDDFVSAQGYENFDRALSAGKGVVVTIAHFGNWELMGGYTAMKGYPCNVVARKIYFEKYDRLLVEVRTKLQLNNIYRDESVRKMLQVLKRNGMLGFVVDQDVETVEGVFVNFFGRHAFTPTAPVRFAVATGAPIIPVFIVREDLRHRMIVEPPIELVDTGDRERDLVTNTQKWVDVQEKYIRRYPHLWVWNHKRWKTQPENLIKKSKEVPIQD
jgi:KDO2-lipid IV(A) lauroyltransferase